MTDLEKLKIILDSPLCDRDTFYTPLQGRSTLFVPGHADPVPYILKSAILEWIKQIEEGKWPLYD